MGKTLDGLISHLIDQVALTGDCGTLPPNFILNVKNYFQIENGALGSTETLPNIDRPYLEYIWQLLLKEPDICVGQEGQSRALTLTEAEASYRSDSVKEKVSSSRPQESEVVLSPSGPQTNGSINDLLETANHDVVQKSAAIHAHGNQHGPMGSIDDEKGQAASDAPNGQVDPRNAPDDEITDSSEKGIRLFASEICMWHALTGHEPDHSRVKEMDMAILSIIASCGPKGILQHHLVRVSGQDKRSLPHRADRLHDGGYIMKKKAIAVVRDGTRSRLLPTSWCVLSRFIDHPECEDEWKRIEADARAKKEDEEGIKLRKRREKKEAARRAMAEQDQAQPDTVEIDDSTQAPPIVRWTADKCTNNQIFDVVEHSGIVGVTIPELRDIIWGVEYRKPSESFTSRIVDAWQVSQPLHLRHLAIVRDTVLRGKSPLYIHYTYNNFKQLVESGKASWKAVTTIAEDVKHGINTAASLKAVPKLDEYGFPLLEHHEFHGQARDATLAECAVALYGNTLKRKRGPRLAMAYRAAKAVAEGRTDKPEIWDDSPLSREEELHVPRVTTVKRGAGRPRKYAKIGIPDNLDSMPYDEIRSLHSSRNMAGKYQKAKIVREIRRRIELGDDPASATRSIIKETDAMLQETGDDPLFQHVREEILHEYAGGPPPQPSELEKVLLRLKGGSRGPGRAKGSRLQPKKEPPYLPSMAAHTIRALGDIALWCTASKPRIFIGGQEILGEKTRKRKVQLPDDLLPPSQRKGAADSGSQSPLKKRKYTRKPNLQAALQTAPREPSPAPSRDGNLVVDTAAPFPSTPGADPMAGPMSGTFKKRKYTKKRDREQVGQIAAGSMNSPILSRLDGAASPTDGAARGPVQPQIPSENTSQIDSLGRQHEVIRTPNAGMPLTEVSAIDASATTAGTTVIEAPVEVGIAQANPTAAPVTNVSTTKAPAIEESVTTSLVVETHPEAVPMMSSPKTPTVDLSVNDDSVAQRPAAASMALKSRPCSTNASTAILSVAAAMDKRYGEQFRKIQRPSTGVFIGEPLPYRRRKGESAPDCQITFQVAIFRLERLKSLDWITAPRALAPSLPVARDSSSPVTKLGEQSIGASDGARTTSVSVTATSPLSSHDQTHPARPQAPFISSVLTSRPATPTDPLPSAITPTSTHTSLYDLAPTKPPYKSPYPDDYVARSVPNGDRSSILTAEDQEALASHSPPSAIHHQHNRIVNSDCQGESVSIGNSLSVQNPSLLHQRQSDPPFEPVIEISATDRSVVDPAMQSGPSADRDDRSRETESSQHASSAIQSQSAGTSLEAAANDGSASRCSSAHPDSNLLSTLGVPEAAQMLSVDRGPTSTDVNQEAVQGPSPSDRRSMKTLVYDPNGVVEVQSPSEAEIEPGDELGTNEEKSLWAQLKINTSLLRTIIQPQRIITPAVPSAKQPKKGQSRKKTNTHGEIEVGRIARTGGSVAMMRKDIIMELVKKCGGVCPSHYEMSVPFAVEWMNRGHAGTPERTTVRTAINHLISAGKLRQLTFAHSTKGGLMKTSSLVTLADIRPDDPRVKALQKAIADNSPTTYLPPEWLEVDERKTSEIEKFVGSKKPVTPSKTYAHQRLQYHRERPLRIMKAKQEQLAALRAIQQRNRLRQERKAHLNEEREKIRQAWEARKDTATEAVYENSAIANLYTPKRPVQRLDTLTRPAIRKPIPFFPAKPRPLRLRSKAGTYSEFSFQDPTSRTWQPVAPISVKRKYTKPMENIRRRNAARYSERRKQAPYLSGHVSQNPITARWATEPIAPFTKPTLRPVPHPARNKNVVKNPQYPGSPTAFSNAAPRSLDREGWHSLSSAIDQIAFHKPYSSPYVKNVDRSRFPSIPQPPMPYAGGPYKGFQHTWAVTGTNFTHGMPSKVDLQSSVPIGQQGDNEYGAVESDISHSSSSDSDEPMPQIYTLQRPPYPKRAKIKTAEPFHLAPPFTPYMDPRQTFSANSGTFSTSFDGPRQTTSPLLTKQRRPRTVYKNVDEPPQFLFSVAPQRFAEIDEAHVRFGPDEVNIERTTAFELENLGLLEDALPAGTFVNHAFPHQHETVPLENVRVDLGKLCKFNEATGRFRIRPISSYTDHRSNVGALLTGNGENGIGRDGVEQRKRRKKRRRRTSATEDMEMDQEAEDEDNDQAIRPTVKRHRVKGPKNVRSLREEEEHRLIIAATVIRCLTGGLDRRIDWTLVGMVFEDGRDEEFIRAKWNGVQQKYQSAIDKFEVEFQDLFTNAYGNGSVPPIDFENLEIYPWKWLVEWVAENSDKPTESPPDLPIKRAEFLDDYDLSCTAELDVNRYYEIEGSTIRQGREATINQTSWTYPAFSPASSAQRDVNEDLTIAKSWIRANVATPQDSYNPSLARDKLSQYPDSTIETALQELLTAKILSQPSNARLIPGRNYQLHEQTFSSHLQKTITVSTLKRAASCKTHLDAELSAHGRVEYSPHAQDGDVICILNLVAAGKIALRTKDVPMNTFGHLDGSYKTRRMDKTRLYCNVDIVPCPGYSQGNPLLPMPPPPAQHLVQWSADPRAEEPKIPLWYDIHDALIPSLWATALAAVTAILVTRPGIGVKEVQRLTKPCLDAWEIAWVLDWMVDAGVATARGEGNLRRWITGEWWWLTVGEEGAEDAMEED